MKNKSIPLFETALLFAGELVVSAIVCAVYLLIHKFSYKVVTGVALGSAVTILNFLFLSITTTRAFNKIAELRGSCSMDEEAALKFALEHQAQLQNAVKLSFIVRTFSMLAALVLALLLDWFDVIATVVPLLMTRPILSVAAALKSKSEAKSTSSKGIEVEGRIIDDDEFSAPSATENEANAVLNNDITENGTNEKAGDNQ